MVISLLLAVAMSGGQPVAAPPVISPPHASTEPLPSRGKSKARAIVNLASLFSADSYPVEALFKGEEGRVAWRLTVGSDGRVKGCVVTKSSGSASLDAATCSILWRSAWFEPARNKRGRPVEDQVHGKVRWVLPAAKPTPVDNGRVRYVFPINADGGLTDCRFDSDHPLEDDEGPNCTAMREMAEGILRAIPKNLPLPSRELVIEWHSILGDGDLGSDIGTATGQTLIRRDRAMLSIDPDGKLIACKEDVEGPLRSTEEVSTCAEIKKSNFEALPPEVTNRSERRMTTVNAVYLREVTPPIAATVEVTL